MTKHVSARDARAHFAELTDEVRYTGEPVIVEKQGRPFVAMINVEDLEAFEQLRREIAWQRFTRSAREAALKHAGPEPTDEEIVVAIKRDRQERYREQHGGG